MKTPRLNQFTVDVSHVLLALLAEPRVHGIHNLFIQVLVH